MCNNNDSDVGFDEIESIDDYIDIMFLKETIYLEKEDIHLKCIKTLRPGDSFGILNFDF